MMQTLLLQFFWCSAWFLRLPYIPAWWLRYHKSVPIRQNRQNKPTIHSFHSLVRMNRLCNQNLAPLDAGWFPPECCSECPTRTQWIKGQSLHTQASPENSRQSYWFWYRCYGFCQNRLVPMLCFHLWPGFQVLPACGQICMLKRWKKLFQLCACGNVANDICKISHDSPHHCKHAV